MTTRAHSPLIGVEDMTDSSTDRVIADFPLPLIGFAAFSGTGKTTLLLKLVPILKRQGMRLTVVKHAHHSFDMDYPGKDSYRLREAVPTRCWLPRGAASA